LPEDLTKVKTKSGAVFSFVSDPDGKLLDLFGARHVGGGPTGEDIARPASVLVAGDGSVLWESFTDNYRVRPKPAALLSEISEMLSSSS